jgi:hypothetical protein
VPHTGTGRLAAPMPSNLEEGMMTTWFRAGALVVLASILAPAGALAGEPIEAMLDPYFRVQSALSSDSMAGVTADAALIAKAAAALGAPGQPIAAAARELAGAGSIADARTIFGRLSTAVIAYADVTKAALGSGVVTAYCPMAKGSWLQRGEKLRNPYYGKSMLTCGEIKKRSS